MSASHYHYLEAHLPKVLTALGQDIPAQALISSHGDKCYGYQDKWAQQGIPFAHGAAIYLLSYLSPFNTECRGTAAGWVPVEQWVANNYNEGHEFSKILPTTDSP